MRKLLIKHILNRILIIIFLLSIFGCNPYYNYNKNYFNNDFDIVEYSSKIDIELPISISFDGIIVLKSKNYKVKGRIKIVNSNRLQFFLYSKTLGIEVLKAEMFNDSIIFIDKINKKYFNGKSSNFKYNYLSSKNLIRIFLGRSFEDVNYFKLENYNLNYKYNNVNIKGELVFNNFAYLEKNVFYLNNKKIEIVYNDYLRKNRLPSKIIGTVENDKLLINFNYYSVSVNNVEIRRISIPKNYEIIDFK